MSETIKPVLTDEDIEACFPVVVQLRPHLRADEFVARVRTMEGQGYRLAYLSADDTVRAVVGYRIIDMLRTGRMLEVDDLVSCASARSRGYGERLLAWCHGVARQEGCSVVELDSAVHRANAHRFYFRERMHILAYHFSRTVS
jgi:GNAT superfamily N-acetyltransferase